jgi:hypothetical protein
MTAMEQENCEFMKMVESQEVYLRTENKTERKGSA